MSKSSRINDVIAVLRGIKLVNDALIKENQKNLKRVWSNSFLKELLEDNVKQTKKCATKFSENPSEELKNALKLSQETFERSSVVFTGLKELIKIPITNIKTISESGTLNNNKPDLRQKSQHESDLNIDISKITLKELEELLSKRSKKRTKSQNHETKHAEEKHKDIGAQKTSALDNFSQNKKNVTSYEGSVKKDEEFVKNVMKNFTNTTNETNKTLNIKLPELSSIAKQRKVPSSRVGRMVSFGNLFAGLGIGTISELTKGALGLGNAKNVKEAFLSPGNAERIVDTLCKVRGAALKLGQILSIQDSNIISPELVKAFERVRQAADYMPDWQVNKVMISELGPEWRSKLKSFDEKPFAAASIGQVHRAVLKDDTEVAIKIQYPGVAKSIESDIDNLVGMLKIWDVFPKGFFIDNVVKVAKRELAWEVDYTREAEYTEKFNEMISKYPEYRVPRIVKDLTTKSVLTSELLPGVPLDKCFDYNYEDRKFIGESVLKLCFRELFEFNCMQTDPNWSNFLFDKNSKKLMLIDFGSTRFYSKKFIENYKKIINAAANNEPQKVLEYSREVGFLTGYETKQMENTHVNAVMILGEVFRCKEEFDFGKQNTIKRIAQMVPTMVAHRLAPPPEEIYSIHRKLFGIFLLCTRLKVKIDCRNIYNENLII